MKALSNKNQTTFLRLVEKMEQSGEECLKLESDSFMPLVIQKILELDYQTIHACEKANNIKILGFYSLSHYFLSNGDVMRDPEVCFCIIEINQNKKVFPYHFRQDDLAIHQKSVFFNQDGRITMFSKQQSDLKSFCSMWLENIKNQGFMDENK